MNSISGDQLRGHLDTMILASLEHGPSHGLGIIQRLEAAGCGLLKLKEGSLYPALYRMEAAGLVTSSAVPVPAGQRGAPRRVYELTRKGTGALAEGRRQWTNFVSVVGGILQATRSLQTAPSW